MITRADKTVTPASDETGEWIFSDEYHDWQDTQMSRGRLLRPGAIPGSHPAVALFQVKPQSEQDIKASWPEPRWTDDLSLDDEEESA